MNSGPSSSKWPVTCDDCEDDGENEERPAVPEGVLRGIEDIIEGNTASKEDLENLCDIDESDHPNPELVEQAERGLSLVRDTMYPVTHGEAYRLQEILEERQSEDRNMSDGDGEKRTIERDCMECGKIIEITVYEDDTYEGGHYFDEFTVPSEDSDGEYKQTGEREGHNVVKWINDEESYEDWECVDCDCSLDQ